MRGLWRVSAILVVLWLVPARGGEPLRGVALVIGEDTYEHLPVLGNPAKDARAIDDLLSSLGFEVTRVLNRGSDRLRAAIEDFRDDAKNADVALIYYSGHGVEVAGQNYLVPTDADIATPNSAGESLIALDNIVDEMIGTVPVTIVLLDACRSEAFPPGTLVQLPGQTAPVVADSQGLAEVSLRGPTALARKRGPDTTLGMAIGFAAQPGSPAFDGIDGEGHSPYAAALLKHFGAGGYSFGDLMTLVAQEVYLKTGSRQLPSVVSSLLGVLSFGAPPAPADSDEAGIAEGRRELLLNIARTPDQLRDRVQSAAAEAGVPMDTLYGLLASLGQKVPKDPDELDRLLKQQTETVRKLMQEHTALVSSDTEIVRLSELAQRALDEGLLDKNLEYRRAAEARWNVIRADIVGTAAQARQRLLEGVATVAQTADALRLTSDYLGAAAKYGEAYTQVAEWDVAKARDYKWSEGDVLTTYGYDKGDNAALLNSIEAYRTALSITPRETAPGAWAGLQNSLGIPLMRLGQRQASNDYLEEARAAFNAALEVNTKLSNPSAWGDLQNNLGIIYETLGDRGARENYKLAVEAYSAGLSVRDRSKDPSLWAQSQDNLGNALERVAERESGTQKFEQAIAAYNAALEIWTRDANPRGWSTVQHNLGVTYVEMGKKESGTANLKLAIEAYNLALEERTREKLPLEWASTEQSLGVALKLLGDREQSTDSLAAAVAAYRAALEERTLDRAPAQWGQTTNNLALALFSLGKLENGTESLEASHRTYTALLQQFTKERNPNNWGDAHADRGEVDMWLGDRINGKEGEKHWLAAIDDWLAATEVFRADNDPEFYAKMKRYAGQQYVMLGERQGDNAEMYEAAIPLMRDALDIQSARNSSQLPYTQANLARALLDLGRLRGDRQMLLEARSLCQLSLAGAEKIGKNFSDVAARVAAVDEALAKLKS